MKASSSSSAPESSSHSWNHEVFLSFRGEDTRKTFVDHLYTALVQQGIYTYKDDEALPRGESIHPALMKAIRESRIAIIVFSENYADSSWCLDELEYIMKCRDETGQIVIPIFYHVDPSEVRKQNGNYGEAFAKHKRKNYDKVKSWRRALVDAGSLSGWVPADVANGHESKFIKDIVDAILKRLCPLMSSIDENLVGLRTRLRTLESKLELLCGGVRMVGIWGVGGGGKTTLATSVYDEIRSKFEGCSNVENIREESIKNGLAKLQGKILSDVLRQGNLKIGGVHEGKQQIANRLRSKKVLIVLDDVDHLDQLHALAGSCDWFGEGSRIIITTRDEHVLKAHKVNVIHNISLLDDKEAFELFCKYAPRVNIPIGEYELLSEEVVSYACGLPLALKVLGCHLCDTDTNEWRSALNELKEIPEDDIVKKLKVSYDGLKAHQKQMFLDIACFFRWCGKDEAMDIFEACGYYPVVSFKVLTQKALITITEDGVFDMHDLIQELGHYIVRGEYLHNPEKHSRVWKHEDIQTLCAMDETTELYNEVLASQHYLALCDFQNHHLANMKKLRWIDWDCVHAGSLSTNSLPASLCCLVLGSSVQTQLWEGAKILPNLRMIRLQHLHNLMETPDFGGLPNLERFEFNYCKQLQRIHPSIGRLEKLAHLRVYECRNFEEFPLIIRSRRVQIYEISPYRMDVIYAYGGREDAFLPQLSIDNIIKGLHVFGEALKTLALNFKLKDGDIDTMLLFDFPNLIELDLSHNNFSRLALSVLKFPRLKCLDVTSCSELVELSGLPSSIAIVIASLCNSLQTVGDMSNCKWLWIVSFYKFWKLRDYVRGQDLMLQSMLQGNAVENHFISFISCGKDVIPKGLVDRLALINNRVIRLQLPHNWFDNFSGFLMCIGATDMLNIPSVKISMKQEEVVDTEYPQFDEDSDDEIEETYAGYDEDSDDEIEETYAGYNEIVGTGVGYVSFKSLMRDNSASLNSANYNTISFELDNDLKEHYPTLFVADLIPRKSKGDDDAVQTTNIPTDSSEFHDDLGGYCEQIFEIKHHSNTSINITWNPW